MLDDSRLFRCFERWPATTTLDRKEAVDFAEFCLNDSYGWLTVMMNIGFAYSWGQSSALVSMASRYVLRWSLAALNESERFSPKPSHGTSSADHVRHATVA
jgi:hypothetical protein